MDEVWTTKDGRKIPVGEMGVEHLRNTLRMLIRNQRTQREKLKASLGTSRFAILAALLRPHLQNMQHKDDVARADAEARFEEDLLNDVFGDDLKWGSD